MDSPLSLKIYTKANAAIETMSRICYFVLMKVTFPGAVIPPLCVTIVNQFKFNLEVDSYRVPFPMTWPFDLQSPFGYSTCFVFQTITTYYVCLIVSVTASFFVGFGWISASILRDITSDLHLMDNLGTSKKHRMEIRSHLSNIIEHYSNVKQFAFQFNNVLEYNVTAIFLWAVLTICSSLLVFQRELSDSDANPIEFIEPIVFGLWSFIGIFLICEVGERLRISFQQFDSELRSCNWYLFPTETQRMLLIVLMSSQKYVVIQEYGNTLCTRSSFSSTVRGGFSYFMTLRRISG